MTDIETEARTAFERIEALAMRAWAPRTKADHDLRWMAVVAFIIGAIVL